MIDEKQWRVDILNTRRESVAYLGISNGYAVLARLPENQSGSHLYLSKSRNVRSSYNECSSFLEKLVKFGEKNGYTEVGDECNI